MTYLIWQSNNTGWHISRTDGKADSHCQSGILPQLQNYCNENNLTYTLHPFEEVVSRMCADTFEYEKVR